MNNDSNRTISELPLGLAIRSIRLQRKLSQRQVAYRLQCPRTYISKIENKSHHPTVNSIFRLCEALNIKPWVFVRYVYRMQKAIDQDPSLKQRLIDAKRAKKFRQPKGDTA